VNEHQHKLQARTSWRAHRNGRPWSRADDAAIREVLDGDDDAVCDVAITLGRTFTSVRARRGLLRGLRDDLAKMTTLRVTTEAMTPLSPPLSLPAGQEHPVDR
jgi:hypothetical protein